MDSMQAAVTADSALCDLLRECAKYGHFVDEVGFDYSASMRARIAAAQSQAAAMAGLLEEAREAIAEYHVAKAGGKCINCDVLARIESALAAWKGETP